ncbi:unnamed protein product [Cylicostephanus goldi]|uniref:Uncharacterized protein n=1 Tax=Cylicostephanus goldi TaxID=71465 RepID=A0A3P6UAS0_CYLGO|nr:unnamed protein product [Cylicostephanus goldi]
MHTIIIFVAIVAVFAHGQLQSSGYENAELVQPAPAVPLSAENGNQQAYNSDGFSAGGSPPAPPPSPFPETSIASSGSEDLGGSAPISVQGTANGDSNNGEFDVGTPGGVSLSPL